MKSEIQKKIQDGKIFVIKTPDGSRIPCLFSDECLISIKENDYTLRQVIEALEGRVGVVTKIL